MCENAYTNRTLQHNLFYITSIKACVFITMRRDPVAEPMRPSHGDTVIYLYCRVRLLYIISLFYLSFVYFSNEANSSFILNHNIITRYTVLFIRYCFFLRHGLGDAYYGLVMTMKHFTNSLN